MCDVDTFPSAFFFFLDLLQLQEEREFIVSWQAKVLDQQRSAKISDSK